MAPRTRRTRRTTTNNPAAEAGPAASIVANLAALLDENRALKKEADRLRALIERLASLAGSAVAPSADAAPVRRRGRRPAAAAAAAAEPAPEAPKVRKPRRKITDPDLLARRRAALAKARAVRAERLAAARQA